MILKFYVIFSQDSTKDKEIDNFSAEKFGLSQTEDDSDYEYDYLGRCWENGHHAKFTGILTKEELKEFICAESLGDACDTMGAITEYGYLPAVSLSYNGYDHFTTAYISPLVDDLKNPELTVSDKNLELLFKAIDNL